MKEQNIEQLFKDALGNLEADVNPGVWTNIEQGLQAPVNVAGNTVASKSAGILGKLGLKSLLMITAASVTVIGTLIYFATEKSETPKTTATALPIRVESVNTPSINNKIETAVPDGPVEKQTKNSQAPKQFVAELNKAGILPVSTVEDSHSNPVTKETTSNPSVPSAVSAPKASHPEERPALTEKYQPAKPSEIKEEKKKADEPNGIAVLNPKSENELVFDTLENYLVPDAYGKKELRNSFSPNGDGKNDIFSLETKDIKSLEVVIFDMSGRQVYSWNSLNGGWDGTFRNGKEAPEGNYYYSVNAQTVGGGICIAKSSLRLFRSSQN